MSYSIFDESYKIHQKMVQIYSSGHTMDVQHSSIRLYQVVMDIIISLQEHPDIQNVLISTMVLLLMEQM